MPGQTQYASPDWQHWWSSSWQTLLVGSQRWAPNVMPSRSLGLAQLSTPAIQLRWPLLAQLGPHTVIAGAVFRSPGWYRLVGNTFGQFPLVGNTIYNSTQVCSSPGGASDGRGSGSTDESEKQTGQVPMHGFFTFQFTIADSQYRPGDNTHPHSRRSLRWL